MLVLIHGGPQGAWGQDWSYRWNVQAFAAAGYVVVMPNPRGSTGYGQKFIDEIQGDWGGRAYDEAGGIADPRIWTAERDLEMWRDLQSAPPS